MTMHEWVSFFIKFILSDDLNEDMTESFLRHLTDLQLLIYVNEDIWGWATLEPEVDSEDLIKLVQDDLESLSIVESGFALAYFIGFKDLKKKPLFENMGDPDSKNINKKYDGLVSKVKPASNLSNLQIVKKVGKQLQPFMQMEEAIISRLVRTHVSKQDAQKLFHYMFSKVGFKAKPRVWEQLSRKRHR
jgi:hypothetical protein